MNINPRKFAKNIPAAFWLAGLFRYINFRIALRKANIDYNNKPQSALPPPMLRYRVHKTLDEFTYNENGKYLSGVIAERINNSYDSTSNLEILDFACGPGRVMVKLKEKIENSNIYGSDIDLEAITWAKKILAT